MLFNKLLYANKTVLITGASSGLGKNLAMAYAKNGAKIINISRNNKKMKKLNMDLNKINKINHLYYAADVSNYKQIEIIKNDLVLQKIHPDVIINNAAGNFLCPFDKLSENGWKRIIDIVLHGNFNITHLFGKEMIEKKKSTIFLNITTTYAPTGSALVAPSAAAKAASDALMKSLTVEWSKHNIRFVGIAPGPINNTGGIDKLDPFKIFKTLNNYTNPRQRMCNPTEISNLAMFLTSPYADYINGEIITIDGGQFVKTSGQFNFITNIPFYDKIIKK